MRPTSRARRRWRASFVSSTMLVTTWLACGGDGDGDGFALTLTPSGSSLEGAHDIDGTVTFPAPLPAGTPVRLSLVAGRPTSREQADAEVTGAPRTPASELRYRIRSLERGTYFLFVWADANRDGLIDSGDLAGYYDGSSLAPNQQPATATPFELARSATAVDFGVAALP